MPTTCPSDYETLQKFDSQIIKQKSILNENTSIPSFSNELQQHIDHRNHIIRDISKLQETKAHLESKEGLYDQISKLKSDLKEKDFRIDYLAKLNTEKDSKIRDVQMQNLQIKEFYDN